MVFQCKNCGGTSIFDPDRQKMYCPYCASEDSESIVPEKDISNCPACGAPVQIGTHTSAGKCTSCGNYIVFDERVTGDYEPHLILPFKFGKKAALDKLREEFGKRAFAPSDFLAESALNHVEGLYVPFFMYDYHSDYDWAGRAVKIRKWRSGDTEYTETKTFRLERDISVDFERIPVDASDAMDDKTMDLLEPYDYKALEEFKAKYMSGFFGEKYNKPAAELEPRAHAKAENDSEEILKSTMPGYTSIIPERRNLILMPKKTHYALLPVWIYSYFYRGKMYQFHVNGQSGKLIGKMPISVGKAWGYTATVFGGVAIIASLLVRILGMF
ncbi:MAG: hypothetical protein KBS85_02340 [Lachnospiraceae bacterium]|nr:hypothetical protein [Candidatus Merdinaster equi]